jgi:hypothetical protein
MNGRKWFCLKIYLQTTPARESHSAEMVLGAIFKYDIARGTIFKHDVALGANIQT